jgi:hypothetical protein
VHDEIGLRGFEWQEGYGAFTVSPSQRAAVRRYIERQDAHHRTRTFLEEYLELLHRSGVELDVSPTRWENSTSPVITSGVLNFALRPQQTFTEGNEGNKDWNLYG